MKYFYVVSLILISACNQNKPCEQVDPKNAKAILTSYFAAVEDFDFEALKELSTDDFIIYEQGSIWNNDSLINAFKSHPEARYDYSLTDFSIKPDCNSAFIVYINKGIITVGDSSFNKTWTENASVRRINGELKLEFIHSSVAR